MLDINFSKFERGKGFFKFNNSLLSDPEYVTMTNNAIRDVKTLYAEDIYDPNYLKKANSEQLQSVLCTINPQLFLGCLLLEIHRKTIAYCAWKKKCKNGKINSDKEPDSEDLKRQLDMARAEVEEYAIKEAEGAQCRARLKWQIDGEKATKYFCNLEESNALQKYIPELIVKNDKGIDITITEPKEVD